MDARGDISAAIDIPVKTLIVKQVLAEPIGDNVPCPNSRNKQNEAESDDMKQRSKPKKKVDATSSEEQLKYRQFLCEPMRDKDVAELPGITPMAACRLREIGCGTAVTIWGKFLTLQKSRKLFQIWLHDVSGAGMNAVRACCLCLEDYCEMYL